MTPQMHSAHHILEMVADFTALSIALWMRQVLYHKVKVKIHQNYQHRCILSIGILINFVSFLVSRLSASGCNVGCRSSNVIGIHYYVN